MSEDNFNLAANFIQLHHQQFSKEHLLKFYAFYKQATIGELDTQLNPKPSFFRINERAKWEGWNSLGKMSQEQAMEKYADLLTELKPEWKESTQNDNVESKQPSFGVSVSRMKSGDDELINEADKTIEDFIREGNCEKLKELLAFIEDINELDENGMGLLHWASDRGNDSILEMILSQRGININLKDSENQTALHYCSHNGWKNCIELLLKYGPNKNIQDNDGNTCIDVAFDDEIKKMLC